MATRPKKSLPLVETVSPKPNGRPCTYTDAQANEIIARVAGGEPLAPVVRGMGIGLTTWYDWCNARPELAARIARARDEGEEVILADTLGIADALPPLTAMGATDGGAVQHAKLRIDTRLKLLAKWNPRKWGDKLAVGGAEDLPAIRSDVLVTLDPSEAYKKLLGE